MNISKLDHIGIAVADLDQAIERFKQLGFLFEQRTRMEDMGLEIAFFAAGESKIELLASLREDSSIGKHLAARGEGIQHLCFAADDFDGALEEYKQKGFRVLGKPVIGAEGKRVFFVHPKDSHRVLIEIIEKG